MTLRERVLFGIVTLILATGLIYSLMWALSPPKSIGTANPQSSQTQTTAPAGNVPTASGQRVDSPAPPAEIVKSTEVSIVRLMLIGIGLQAAGFLFVFWQVYQLKRGIQGETHSKLYEHYLKVTEMLLDAEEDRSYFYVEGAAASKNIESKPPDRVDMLSEVILGLLEHAAVQKKNLPSDSWERCWQAYTYERFDRSPALRKFFEKNKNWYAESFLQVIDERTQCKTLGSPPEYWTSFIKDLKKES